MYRFKNPSIVNKFAYISRIIARFLMFFRLGIRFPITYVRASTIFTNFNKTFSIQENKKT